MSCYEPHEYDFQEKVDFYADTESRCRNCNSRNYEEVATDEGWILLCDECAEEERRVENETNELANLPGCPDRQRLIDDAQSTRKLLFALRAHDVSGCAHCAAIRKPVQSERRNAGLEVA
jgi:hypothetical protein